MNPKITIPKPALAAFCRENGIRRLSVFGSALREDFGPGSDIDLLVEFESGAQIGFMKLARMQRELAVIIHRKVDLVPQEGLKSIIRTEALSGAEVIYAA